MKVRLLRGSNSDLEKLIWGVNVALEDSDAEIVEEKPHAQGPLPGRSIFDVLATPKANASAKTGTPVFKASPAAEKFLFSFPKSAAPDVDKSPADFNSFDSSDPVPRRTKGLRTSLRRTGTNLGDPRVFNSVTEVEEGPYAKLRKVAIQRKRHADEEILRL